MKLKIEIEIGSNELMVDYSDLSLAMAKLMREFDTAHRNGEVEELRGVINELWKFVQDARQGVLLS